MNAKTKKFLKWYLIGGPILLIVILMIISLSSGSSEYPDPEDLQGQKIGKWLIQNHTPDGIINLEKVLIITDSPAQLIWWQGDKWLVDPAIKGKKGAYVSKEAYERLGDEAEMYWVYDGKNLTYGIGIQGIQTPKDPNYNTIKPIK